MTISEQVVRPEPTRQIAARIVNECLRVKENEQVTINTWAHTLDYASAVAIEVEKAGAVANLSLETDDFYWAYLTEIPEAQYKRQQKAYLSMLDATDATIGLGGPKDPAGFQRAPPERIAKMMEGEKEISDRFRELKIRSLGLPIGLVTPERARTYGFNYEQWRSTFSTALNVDHGKMSAQGQKIATRLKNGENVRVAAPNGTDLRFKLGGRPVHVRDGILDDADIAKGTLSESLPAGVVELAPDESSADGTINFDQPTALRGKMLDGLKWRFDSGRLVETKALANADALTDLYEAASGDKDKLASFSIGLNPSASLVGLYTDRVVAGVVTVGIGGNKELGGKNESQFGHLQSLRKPTVEVDGYKLVADGRIQA